MKYTPEIITTLQPNEVFVFGSNEGGYHGAGAARIAMEKFGAIYKQGEGLQGQSYGIPTKDKGINTLPLAQIFPYVNRFVEFAINNPQLTFLVTKIGCGYAGYKPEDIKSMFVGTPDNVILPKEFS